ncbi:MAG: hypothetical protein WDM85_13705, partial [Caulobacteraceae bacterium]
MKLRYVANACFLITLSGGKRILTDPWFCGTVPADLVELPAGTRAPGRGNPPSRPRLPLHQPSASRSPARREPGGLRSRHAGDRRGDEHAQPEERLGGAGFRSLIETPFATRAALADTGAELVLFKDFHGNTLGDDTQVDYDLDTSLYLFDADGDAAVPWRSTTPSCRPMPPVSPPRGGRA